MLLLHRLRIVDGDDGDNTVLKHLRLQDSLERLGSTSSGHHPVNLKGRAQDEDGNIVDKRPHCKMCGFMSSFSCELCRVGLCLIPRDGQTVSC